MYIGGVQMLCDDDLFICAPPRFKPASLHMMSSDANYIRLTKEEWIA